MSVSPPTSPRKTSLDEEPLLPTYEQFQTTDVNTPETPPEATATADQIRDFLVAILTSKRGLALDHARRIASKWTIGNGKELRSYPSSMYLEIFGREDGWIVYKETKLCIVLDERSKKPKTPFSSHCIALAVCLAVLGGVCWLFYWGITRTNAWAIVGSSVMFLPSLSMTISCISSFSESNPETKIEDELQECMKKCGAQQS